MIPQTLFMALLLVLLVACDGGGSSGSCDRPLTVAQVDAAVRTNPVFTQDGVSLSGTKLIHDDGNQGSSLDLLRLVLARATHPDGDTLIFAYSAKNTIEQIDDTFYPTDDPVAQPYVGTPRLLCRRRGYGKCRGIEQLQ